jgi:HlyD family secretion protein
VADVANPPPATARSGVLKTSAPNWRLLGSIAAAVAVVGGVAVWWFALRPAPTSYVTATMTRGDVATTIAASGTINPETTVAVGTYVSGTIVSLTCDFNTRVHQGQLCAKIDPAPYQIIVEEDQANLAQAQAQLVKDQANVVYTKLASDRDALLLSENSTSRDASDSTLNAYRQAVALVGVDEATIRQRAALLKAAGINLNYTNIVSPVDGTVVTRDVTAGQTVAASLQTPTLFLIATDLTKMQVDTSVSESDIAGATQGADATFTVDAFPNRTFRGTVTQVRQSPVSVQNVITYDVVITVANPDLLLKPGMTATVAIVKAQSRNVLRVPSQALRFTPAGAPGAAPGSGGRARGGPASGAGQQQGVWVLRDGKLVRVPVTVGLNDDTFAEIRAGDLRPGDQVVTAVAVPGQPATPRAGTTTTPPLRL